MSEASYELVSFLNPGATSRGALWPVFQKKGTGQNFFQICDSLQRISDFELANLRLEPLIPASQRIQVQLGDQGIFAVLLNDSESIYGTASDIRRFFEDVFHHLKEDDPLKLEFESILKSDWGTQTYSKPSSFVRTMHRPLDRLNSLVQSRFSQSRYSKEDIEKSYRIKL